MTDLQTLILRASEMRGRLSELGGIAEPSEENIQEIDALRNEYKGNEARQRALMLAGDDIPDPIETRDSTEGRELRRLLTRANFGQMVDNIIGRNPHTGAESEIATHYGLGGHQVPVTLLRNWETQPLERRAAVVVPTDVGQEQMEILDYVFPMSVGAYLGIDTPTVPVGDNVYPVMSQHRPLWQRQPRAQPFPKPTASLPAKYCSRAGCKHRTATAGNLNTVSPCWNRTYGNP